MARVNYSVFAARKGATLHCQKCGGEIGKGVRYAWSKPRFGRRRVRHDRPECAFKRSELDTSKMSGVWAAIEDAEANLSALRGNPGEVGDIEQIMADAAESIRGIGEEYREAAEASPTGLVFGEDLNEKADTIDSGADEIEQWSADEDEPDFDQCENEAHGDGTDEHPGDLDPGDPDCSDCESIREQWWDDLIDDAESALSDAEFE